ncbi:MAG: hypothetical protein IPG58_16515 [Acidobacteria bacterium]|nr:hypothetical protein [Acidobacteriota bacterium]
MNEMTNGVVTDEVIQSIQEDGSPSANKSNGYEEKNWTVMVYLAGDSNLNVEMAYALEQIRVVTEHNKNISLYVYFDGFSADVPTMYCDFSGLKSEYFQSRYVPDKVLTYNIDDEDLNENSAAISNVINFIDWCEKRPEL